MKRALKIGGGIAALLVGTPVVLLGTPLLDPDLASRGGRTASYEEACGRIQAVQDAEASLDLRPAGHSIALLTGARTPTSVVIFHGYTSVPEQFQYVAQAYRDQGCNVWVPRLPHHGETNLLTDGPSSITAESMRDFADEAVSIGAALGERVIVIGLSGGGSLGVWSAVARPDVSQVFLISPLLLPQGYPEWQLPLIIRALRLSPIDVYNWWDPAIRDTGIHPYGYPRYSLKGLAGLLGLTRWADSAVRAGLSTSRARVTLVRNDGDPHLDSAFNEMFLTRLVTADRLTVVRIPAGEGLGHDLVCAHPGCENYARIGVSYRYLSEALGIPLGDPSAG